MSPGEDPGSLRRGGRSSIQSCHSVPVSYVDRKLRLRWGEDGVAVNPALKLLQYNVGTPLELRETGGYRQEKDGEPRRLRARRPKGPRLTHSLELQSR